MNCVEHITRSACSHEVDAYNMKLHVGFGSVYYIFFVFCVHVFFFFQAEDGIRYLVRSRGLGDVYKRQHLNEPGA